MSGEEQRDGTRGHCRRRARREHQRHRGHDDRDRRRDTHDRRLTEIAIWIGKELACRHPETFGDEQADHGGEDDPFPWVMVASINAILATSPSDAPKMVVARVTQSVWTKDFRLAVKSYRLSIFAATGCSAGTAESVSPELAILVVDSIVLIAWTE